MPRPGRRARWAAVKAAYGGGTVGAALATGAVVLVAEAKHARRTIGVPTTVPPVPDGSYGRGKRGQRPLHLAVVGDSAAAGLGCERPEETPGALVAGAIARDLGRRVELEVVAVSGARSSDLDAQVARALHRRIDAAFVIIGANDVTHRVPIASAVRDLSRAVATLREAGAVVVVGTCPDLGTVKPVLQPLRTVAAQLSRRMARAQTVAVVEAGGIAVSLGNLLARTFSEEPHLWSADRFHPSAEGYRRIVDAMLPSLLEGLGVEIPVSVPVSESVQDVVVAAGVAAREPGLAVETLEGGEGAAAVGPGRLARLRRRLPLVGRGAPAGLTEPEELAADRAAAAEQDAD